MELLKTIPDDVKHQVMRQLDGNKVWRENDTRRNVKERIIDEYFELLEEIELDRNIAFLIASECGDILYLALKYHEMGGEPDPDIEFAVQEAFEVCEATGLDPKHCILMKILRNDFKYVPMVQNNGYSMQESVVLSKMLYQTIIGGDDAFSQAWLEHAEQITYDEPIIRDIQ